jgi:hypothetical protein
MRHGSGLASLYVVGVVSLRSQLGRVRGCLSVLGQQLQEARREAGDDMDDESPAGSPLKSHARHRADHRGLQGEGAITARRQADTACAIAWYHAEPLLM